MFFFTFSLELFEEDDEELVIESIFLPRMFDQCTIDLEDDERLIADTANGMS